MNPYWFHAREAAESAARVFGFKLLQLHRDPRSLTATPTATTRTPQPA